jgi:hypothetical protein
MSASKEFKVFSNAMSTILKSDPEVVKLAMEEERKEREEEAKRTGKRGRGRPPKISSFVPASSSRDA